MIDDEHLSELPDHMLENFRVGQLVDRLEAQLRHARAGDLENLELFPELEVTDGIEKTPGKRRNK